MVSWLAATLPGDSARIGGTCHRRIGAMELMSTGHSHAAMLRSPVHDAYCVLVPVVDGQAIAPGRGAFITPGKALPAATCQQRFARHSSVCHGPNLSSL